MQRKVSAVEPMAATTKSPDFAQVGEWLAVIKIQERHTKTGVLTMSLMLFLDSHSMQPFETKYLLRRKLPVDKASSCRRSLFCDISPCSFAYRISV